MNKIVAVSAIAAAVPVAAVAMPTAYSPPSNRADISPDQVLLDLEEQIFAAYWAANENDEEIERLGDIWRAEAERLYDEVYVYGRSELTDNERRAIIFAMPEFKEHDRLVELAGLHHDRMNELIEQMWKIPATTPEGRRSKLLVLLTCVLESDWRVCDEYADYDIKMARDLMIEFIGGEPARQLRDQFS